MDFRLESMTEEDARTVCGWRYPKPYDVYRWPRWERMAEQGREFADPEIRAGQYLSVRSTEDGLAGYVQLFPMDRAVRIGLGLRPDLCGLGLGSAVVRLAAEEARRRFPAAEIDLEVEIWNRRAVKAYRKAGFTVEDEYDKLASQGRIRVLCMVWRPQPASVDKTVE